MPEFDNMAVAARLDTAANLLELSGADKFRFLSYRKAADAIRAWPEQVADLAAETRLTDIPGVGDKMAANVAEILQRGSFGVLDALSEKYPPGLAEVMKVPGVGPKRAVLLHEKLGVAGLDDLEAALEDGSVARMGGVGEKTAARIAKNLESHKRHSERTPLAVVLPVAQGLARLAGSLEGAERVEIVGSIRRRQDTVGNVDLLVEAADAAQVIDAFASVSAVERVVERGDDRVVVELHDGLEASLTVAPAQRFGVAMQHLTGSVPHNVALERIAREQGVSLSEAQSESEDAIYSMLGMQMPEPEIRWGEEEIELAQRGELPRLLEPGDVRGDLQSHSTSTDGKGSLAENRATCAELGYEYFAATDHAYELRMVGGLSPDEIRMQWEEIDRLNAEPGPRILKGIELNVGEDGSLDYDDEFLARFDVVLASLHSGWDQDTATVTRRMLSAISHPLVDIIAHPTGRILGRRDPMALDMEEVLAAAGETGTIMEINSYPDRLDLSAEHLRLARRFGVRFSLGTDAHSPAHFLFMPFGVTQARRGFVTKEELVNAQPWDVAKRWLKRNRMR